MKTEMLWSASGAMTDLAILVTPMGCELEALPPPDTTFRASQVASATLMCSDCGSSEKAQREEARTVMRPIVSKRLQVIKSKRIKRRRVGAEI